jgi:transposase
MKQLIRENRRLTIREIAEELNIYYGTCQSISIEDLHMRRVSAKFVPRLAHGSLRAVFFFLAKHSIPVIQQPPYSPDLAPCDFWLFPQLKMVLKGKRFNGIETIHANTTKHLENIPKNSYKKMFQQWQNRWHNCIGAEGEYFEGD